MAPGDEPAQTYDVIERDTVPATAPQPNETMQKRIDRLVKWLQPTDYLSPGNEFMKHLHSYVPGTGTWVHESAPFRAWACLDSAGSSPNTSPSGAVGGHHCLHVRGVAGSGKSVFAANTVRQLQESGCVVLFFFFRQIVDKNHTARYLVRDFAAQMLPHCHSLVTTLTALSQEHAVRGNELGLVWPALVEALKDENLKGRMFCVVDALDEMDDGDFEGMVERLVALTTKDLAAARVMMTSRPLPHIEQVLGHPGVVRLRLDPALLSPDVARYVDNRMGTLEPPLSDDKKDLVRQTICERANGLFLQARLIADNLTESLRDGRITETTLPDSLDRLPCTLRAVYEDMLEEHARRSGVTAEQQAKILMCVTHASRPLRLIELGSLLSRMLHVDLRRGKDLVRAGCGRLLELLEDETVSVIHHSFTEFLHDESRKDDQDAFPVLKDETSHAMLAVLLLEYLDGCPHLDADIDDRRPTEYDNPGFSGEERKRRDKIRTDTRVNQPLASYAIDNLFFHINKIPQGASAKQVLAALDCYLVPGKPAFETWMLMKWSGPLSLSCSIFHLITATRDGKLVPVYLMEHFADRKPELLDSRDSDGLTPLAYAAGNDYGDFIEVLLARGADPTSGGNDGLTPLHRAAERGSAVAVRHLLSAGVDPLLKTWPVYTVSYGSDIYVEKEVERRRKTALACAFRGDNTEVVKTFMPFIPADEINKCLHAVDAVENVRAILETGKAEVDCLMSGATKLFWAANGRKLDVIKLLLEHGADPNRRSDTDPNNYYHGGIIAEEPHLDCARGPTPLHAFAGLPALLYERRLIFEEEEENTAACLRVLIEAGADVNATMDNNKLDLGQNMTPLHLAVQASDHGESWGNLDHSEEILTKLLLAAGANPDARTKNGNTPLHLANMEKPRLLEILVEHGADINALNAWGRSPLLEMINRLKWCSYSWNKVKPSVKLFHELLELGADVHLVDNEGDNIFHHIIRSIRGFVDPKFMPLIKKLLREGVNLNRRNKKDQPPLWGYRIGEYSSSVNDADDEKVLRVLAGGGMDMNARDGKGRTFLWGFSTQYRTEFETMNKFIRLGADPGAFAHDGSTLLHSAAEEAKKPEWFRNLILAGARPDALDKHGNTVIHAVLRKPRMSDNAQEVLQEVLQVLVEAGALPLAKNVKGQSALHVVGNLDSLEIVLSDPAFRGLDINEPDVDGYTPLHHAATIGEKAVWRVLNAGSDVTALAADGVSPLHLAALSGNSGTVGLLIAKYRELNAIEKHIRLRCGGGKTPLHYACKSAIPEIVWMMLRNGAEARITDNEGLTPLHILAKLDPPKTSISRAGEIVGMLKLAGADVNAEAVLQAGDEKTSTVSTPLDIAAERKSWDVVRRLIAHGAEPRDGHRRSVDFVLATDKKKAAEQARNAQANVPRSQGSSTSHRGRYRPWRGRWAACPRPEMPLEEGTHFVTGGQDILDAKTQKGDVEDNSGGDSDAEINGTDILHRVLQDADYDTVKEYAQLGGDILELDHDRHHTFLHHLVKGGHADLLEYFGDKVAELEAQEWVQKDEESCGTLLGTACERHLPSLHIIQLLVDKLGVDVNAVYNRQHSCHKLQGATALHILATGANFWQVEALEYLLSKGADIEARNKSGMTPLLAAIEKMYGDFPWREETVRVLLRHGADVNATMKTTGSSALELSDQPGITKLLLENGASVESCRGRLTSVVREWMNPGIVELLLNAGVNPNELRPLQEKQNGKGQHEKCDESVENGDGEEQDCIEEPDEPLCYALHEATRPANSWVPEFDFKRRQQAVIGLLVSHGADLYSPYPDGSFVLQAIVEERGEVRSLLAGLSQTNCNRKGHHGRTLLVSACAPVIPTGSLNPQTASVMPCVVHALLDSGADPLAADNEGRTPLHWFCTFPGLFDEECREAYIALACHGLEAVKISDNQGRKPLHLALATYASGSQQSAFAIQHLLSFGADPGDPDPLTGNSALHFIAPRLVGESTAAATAAGLLRELTARVDIDARNDAGETCVVCFAAAGWEETRDRTRETSHTKALDVFTDLGADLMVVDARKRTLLHVTAGRETPDSDWNQIEDVEGAFKRLMELGVDPRAEDDELRTAIDIAVARGLHRIIRLFSEEGKRIEEETRKTKKSQSAGESEGDEFDGL